MKVVIDIPKDFGGDYIADKFKDFFSRVIADIDCKGKCSRYEKKIAEMFLKAFDNSEEKISCNCQNNSNPRDNESCCGCDSRQTNADRIRNMSDEELADWLTNMCDIERHEESYKSIYNFDTGQEEEIHDSYGDLLNWLRSETE